MQITHTFRKDGEHITLYVSGKKVCRANLRHNPKGGISMGGGWEYSQKIPHVLYHLRTNKNERNKGYACYILNYIKEIYEKKGEPISWYADPDENLQGFYFKRGATILCTRDGDTYYYAFIKEEDIKRYWPKGAEETLEFLNKTRLRRVCTNRHREPGEEELYKCQYIFDDNEDINRCRICESLHNDDGIEIIKTH